MADNHRQKRYGRHFGGVLYGVLAHVQIAVIEPRAQDPNQHLAGFDIGNRHLVDSQQIVDLLVFSNP